MTSTVKTLAALTQSWFCQDPELQVEILGSAVNQLGLQIISNRSYVSTRVRERSGNHAHSSLS